MIKVQSHGRPYRVNNPAKAGQANTMINVVFVEEGRSGANQTLASSSAFLNQLVGANTGLSQVRTHTQPVLAETIDKYAIDAEFPGHINRTLYSSPQLQNQVDKAPRMIDGRPTYFITELANIAKDDVDNRLPVAVAAQLFPETFNSALVSTAEVQQLTDAELEEFETAPAVKKPGRRALA